MTSNDIENIILCYLERELGHSLSLPLSKCHVIHLTVSRHSSVWLTWHSRTNTCSYGCVTSVMNGSHTLWLTWHSHTNTTFDCVTSFIIRHSNMTFDVTLGEGCLMMTFESYSNVWHHVIRTVSRHSYRVIRHSNTTESWDIRIWHSNECHDSSYDRMCRMCHHMTNHAIHSNVMFECLMTSFECSSFERIWPNVPNVPNAHTHTHTYDIWGGLLLWGGYD